MNNSKHQPPFLRRIHEREAARTEAAKKEAEEAAKRRKIVLALDICIAVLKTGQVQTCQHRPRRARKKDFLSHLGDFFFGE
ncbi:MAG: hypothetical protein M0Z50_03330 [Planctomycetia bacterium]|nr:hypothetical protein [Planctomycetia bacterium]